MSGVTDEEWQKMTPDERTEYQIKNCIFCKIISGEIPSKKVFENSNFIGILDINPGAKGHVLVLPKKHVQIMPQLGTELNGELGIVVKTISNMLIKSLGVTSTSVFVANGLVAGQNAPHFMLHVIPRKKEDNINLNPELKKIELSKIITLRNQFLKALGLPSEGINNESIESESKKDLADSKKESKIESSTNNNANNNNTSNDVNANNASNKNNIDKDVLDKIKEMFD